MDIYGFDEALTRLRRLMGQEDWFRKKVYEDYTYVLSAASREAADKWHQQHLKENKICRDAKAGVDYIFSHSSGIGVSTDVRCRRCKEEHSVTDYSNW